MSTSVKNKIESSLKEIRYHPDYVDEAEDEFYEAAERFRSAGSPESMKDEIYSYGYDATLMLEKYFLARIKFLTKLVTLLGDRPEKKLIVAEDGCGSGIDLHVVHSLLAEKVTLTGIDKNEVSLARASARVPAARLIPDFNEDTYDIIYSDFVSIDSNKAWDIGKRGDKTFNALRAPGVVMQNTDMGRLGLHLRFFGKKFSRIIEPELLARIDNNPDCYLCSFEK